jgi:NADPH-dependent ferric siderophore reductase
MPPTTSPNPTGHGRPRAPRHPPELWRVPVTRTERVTPGTVRVTVAGDALATFPGGGGDQHVVLYFYAPGADVPEPLTLASARVAFAHARPAMRSYTVRRFDPAARELDLDFVVHGGHGVAAAWAEAARPGDPLILVGPSPAYVPDPDVADHLFAGDETALPAVAALLAELPAGARATVVCEVADAAERQPLPSAADVDVTWLHRDGRAAGERGTMTALRDHLTGERGLPRARVRTATYWRLGHEGS